MQSTEVTQEGDHHRLLGPQAGDRMRRAVGVWEAQRPEGSNVHGNEL
jgi:hypothetical protein